MKGIGSPDISFEVVEVFEDWELYDEGHKLMGQIMRSSGLTLCGLYHHNSRWPFNSDNSSSDKLYQIFHCNHLPTL